MKIANIPEVKLKFIKLDKDRVRNLRPTTVLDIRKTNSTSFHEDGLFSTNTFGRLGTKERDQTFSYINLNTTVFHPLYYRELCKLKSLYEGILTGKKYAVFNTEENDFILADILTGKTGYLFFMSNFDKLVFSRNGSKKRDARIDFLEKYKDSCTYDKILVLPAGLRDITENSMGRETEGEINPFYRRIIGASNSLISNRTDSPLTDTSRIGIQTGFNNVFNHLALMLKGKHGFITGKWGKRGIATTSRSVLTSVSTATEELGSDTSLGFNQSAVGLFQACKSQMPLVQFAMINFTQRIFKDNRATLIDKNTLNAEVANITTDDIDLWTTPTGIEKIVNSFKTVSFRTEPCMVGENYYLALVWVGEIDGIKCVKIIHDKNEVPEQLKDKGVTRPITYTELLYLTRFNEWNKDIYFISRYPITGDESIYPSFCYIRTTVNSEVRYGLNPDWTVNKELKAVSYPILENASFQDSLSVHPSRLAGLGGDHDGDKISSLAVFTQSAKQEVVNYLNTPEAYINGDKKMMATSYVDSVNRVLHNITGD